MHRAHDLHGWGKTVKKDPEEPLFKTLTQAELEMFMPLTKEEIFALLEKGRLARDAAEKCWGSCRTSGIYFR